MNIRMNRSIQNIIFKSAITIGLTLCSMIATIMGYSFWNCIAEGILHPPTHEYDFVYACKPSTMTGTEATVLVIYMIGLMLGLFFILRKLKFSIKERFFALTILLFVNLFVALILRETRYIQVIC